MKDASVSPYLAGLYQRALICRAFPAYRLDELRDTPAREIILALQLLDLAQQVNS